MRNTLFFLLSALSFSVSAQLTAPDLISSNGGYAVSAFGSIAWSVGEPVSDTHLNSYILTKGFHQPRTINVSSVQDINTGGSVFLYPNPVVGDLYFDFSNIEKGTYRLEIFDVSGKLLLQKEFRIEADTHVEKISMEPYADGLYLVKFSNSANAKTKLFRVIKNK